MNSLDLNEMKGFYFGMVLMSLISCSTYQTAERHLNRKMQKAGLTLYNLELNGDGLIEYWDSGDTTKPTMLLVHGFGATTKYQWYKQVSMLSTKYRVIAPNLNYFGRTEPDSPDYSVAGQVEELEKLCASLKIDTMTVFGVSYGGLVGIEFSKSNQEKVMQMILFDTPVKFADSTNIDAVKTYFNAPSIEELFVPSEPKGLKKLMFLATGKKMPIPGSFLKSFHENAYAYNLEDKRQLITGLLQDMDKYTSSTYDFDCPILLIWGSEDKVVPLTTGEKLRDYLGKSTELYVVEGAAHMPNMTHKKEFNKKVASFLEIEN